MVRPLPTLQQLLHPHQRMKGNEQTIESLAHRVKALVELLRSPVSEDDVEEHERRQILDGKPPLSRFKSRLTE